jgi:hypothetical protein
VKKLFILLTGVGLGLGLAVVLFGSGLPGGSQEERATSEARSPVDESNAGQGGTEAVKVNGRVIRTRKQPGGGSQGDSPANEPQTVEVNGRTIRTRGEPEENEMGGELGVSREEKELKKMRRDYEKKTDEYESQLPIDPETAEKLLEALGEGAERFGGSTVPQGGMASDDGEESGEE